jgi:hypothetical protein
MLGHPHDLIPVEFDDTPGHVYGVNPADLITLSRGPLDVFRDAKTLMWKQHTVFEPHRGDNGTLIADGVHKLPLDTFSGVRKNWPPMSQGAGNVMVDPETLDDTREAVRAWCREQIGRDDIRFED